jgi:DNA-binding GntR family transcriptional regulator
MTITSKPEVTMASRESVVAPIARDSLPEIAFTKLVQAISEGEFQPGEKLSETDLARRFGISRGPLREALQRLEGRLVTRRARVGVHILEFTPEKLGELFTVREALEGMAAALAARKASREEVEKLRELLVEHAKDPALASGAAYKQRSFDDDFHAAIVRMSRNDTLQRLLFEELYYQLRLYRYRSSVQAGRARTAYEQHLQIVDAIERGDAAGAEGAMRSHIRSAYANLSKELEQLA